MPFLILYGLGAKGQVDPKALVCSRSGLFAAPTAHHQRHAAAATRRSPGCAVGLQVSKPPGPRVATTWCVAWHGFRVPSSRTRLDENDSRVTGSGEFLRDLEPGDIAAVDHCFPVWAVKPRRKVEKKVGCNHWLPDPGQFRVTTPRNGAAS